MNRLTRARLLALDLDARGIAARVLTGDAAGGSDCVVVAVGDRFLRPLRSGRWVVQTDDGGWTVDCDDVDAMMGENPSKETL